MLLQENIVIYMGFGKNKLKKGKNFMGKAGKKIVGVDVNKLIDLLNKALADEWLAYYQYWIGSKVVSGIMSDKVQSELLEHATEELLHADMLTDRILQLKGKPILDPKEWQSKTNCGYLVPVDFNVKPILEQNIEGERCAIEIYKEILEFVRSKDDITFDIILKILKDEIKHEDDLENILENDLK